MIVDSFYCHNLLIRRQKSNITGPQAKVKRSKGQKVQEVASCLLPDARFVLDAVSTPSAGGSNRPTGPTVDLTRGD